MRSGGSRTAHVHQAEHAARGLDAPGAEGRGQEPHVAGGEVDGADVRCQASAAAHDGQDDRLGPYRPKTYTEQVAGRTAADLGSEPILHMRHFQKHDVLPEALVTDVQTR